ncbi:MAG: putative histidine kinase, atypical hybrid, partial [Phycisphaerales bacterium]|nr:putative histidine kinase, atypical hybrid [Phycisphaerales bacterium]
MTAGTRPDSFSDLAGVQIVVVDDEPDGRVVIKRILEDCGAVVRMAGAANEAMELIAEKAPHILISDIG